MDNNIIQNLISMLKSNDEKTLKLTCKIINNGNYIRDIVDNLFEHIKQSIDFNKSIVLHYKEHDRSKFFRQFYNQPETNLNFCLCLIYTSYYGIVKSEYTNPNITIEYLVEIDHTEIFNKLDEKRKVLNM